MLDFNPETEILHRHIASMTSGQKDFVMYGLIVTMIFTLIFVVIILVSLIRKLRIPKKYSQQNDELIKAEITHEQGTSV